MNNTPLLFAGGILAVMVGVSNVAPVQAQSLGHIVKDAVVGHSPYEGYGVGSYGYQNYSYQPSYSYNPYVVPRVNTYPSVVNPYFNTPYTGYGVYGRPKRTVHRIIDSFAPRHFD